MIDKKTKPRVRLTSRGWFRVQPFWAFYSSELRRLHPSTVLIGPFRTACEAIRNG